jgi:transcriptional regulator with XRE-family HTH domain
MNAKGYRHTLDDLIKAEVKKRKQNNVSNASVQGVMQDLADYCKITTDAIYNYRKYKAIPLLAIAYRMAEYLGVTVLELYQIENYESALGKRNEHGIGRGRKKEDYNKNCKECGEIGYAKGFCLKHYQQHRRFKLNKL